MYFIFKYCTNDHLANCTEFPYWNLCIRPIFHYDHSRLHSVTCFDRLQSIRITDYSYLVSIKLWTSLLKGAIIKGPVTSLVSDIDIKQKVYLFEILFTVQIIYCWWEPGGFTCFHLYWNLIYLL